MEIIFKQSELKNRATYQDEMNPKLPCKKVGCFFAPYEVSCQNCYLAKKEEGMEDKELREKLAKRLAIQTLGDESLSGIYVWDWVVKNGFVAEYLAKADQIHALIKEAGWIDPATMVMPGKFGTPKAEDSFKAGIKEVVDWVDKNWLDSSNLKQWQAKLKDWGEE